MSSVKFSALLMGAALFVGMGTTTLSADMKCGAGKCGSSPEKQKKYMKRESGKCGAQNDRGAMQGNGNMMQGNGNGMMQGNGNMQGNDNMMRKNAKSGANN